MPIRPENRQRYPADWPQISLRIRAVRSGGRCECEGECRTGHDGRCEARNGQPSPATGSKVVLTVAHLDHTPEHCDDANLRAFCQRCHLAYDAGHHAASRAAARARALAALMDPLPLAGQPASGPGAPADPVIEWLESPESDTWRRFNVRPVYHHLGGGRATSEVPMPLAQILPQPERGHRQFSGRGLRAEHDPCGRPPLSRRETRAPR